MFRRPARKSTCAWDPLPPALIFRCDSMRLLIKTMLNPEC
jgi:hypothetical protein